MQTLNGQNSMNNTEKKILANNRVDNNIIIIKYIRNYCKIELKTTIKN